MSVYNKIINPETGRAVSINGKLGKNILSKFIKAYQNTNQIGGAGILATKWDEIPKEFPWMASIKSKSNKEYYLLFFDGNNYRKLPAAHIIESIITSNQHAFRHPYWDFNGGKNFLSTVENSGNILPKIAGSYSAILIDDKHKFNRSKAPKILGYIVCTRKINSSNNYPYIYIDFIELLSWKGGEGWPRVQGDGLCLPMLSKMMAWIKNYLRIYSFKIWNASENGMAARKCYLMAGLDNNCSLEGGPGGEEGWFPVGPINYLDNSIEYVVPQLSSMNSIPDGNGKADETYYLVDYRAYGIKVPPMPPIF